MRQAPLLVCLLISLLVFSSHHVRAQPPSAISKPPPSYPAPGPPAGPSTPPITHKIDGSFTHPVPYSRIVPSKMRFKEPDHVKLHNRSLNDYGIAMLAPNGKIAAMQWFMKRKQLPVMSWDVERYLEILAYAHELMEWGLQGPPGGFSITNIPPVQRKKRKAVEWTDELENVLEELVGAADKKSLAELYVNEIQPILDKFEKWLIGSMRQKKETTHGELITLFDETAENKYLKFLERRKRADDYVEAVGNYILVPKNTDLNWLQTEFRKISKEQRHKRYTLDKFRYLASKFRANKL